MSEVVVRGYILPYSRGVDVIYAERVTGEKALEILAKIFRKVLSDFCRAPGRSVNSAEDLNKLLNMFTIYLKSLLYLDPIRDRDRVIIASPISYLYNYYIEKHIHGKRGKLYTKNGILNYVGNLADEVRRAKVGRKVEFETKDMLELLKVPADTRPAANTSGLLLHLLVTSAVASSIYIYRSRRVGFSSRKLALIRLLSLFHDVGKFITWSKHEESSARILRELLLDERYVEVGSEAWDIVNRAIEMLRSPPEKGVSEEYDIFRLADRCSSGFDRIIRLLPDALPNDTKRKLLEKINEYFGRAYRDLEDALKDKSVIQNWDFWNRYLSISDVEEITRKFCKYISRISTENRALMKLLSEDSADVLTDKIEIIRIDIRRIQQFIRSNDLRALMGGSRVVDIVVYASIPDLVMDLDPSIPYECITTFGGGNLTIIAPRDTYELIREKFCSECDLGIEISIGKSRFYENYTIVDRELSKSLTIEKTYDVKDKSIDLESIFKKCEFCGVEIALKDEDVAEGKRYICGRCSFKRKVGDDEYFIYRVEVYPEISDDEKALFLRDLLKGDIPVYIAGNSLKKACNPLLEEEKYKNLAIVKFDGNVIGQFMASSISITDAFERSIRVDYAVKSAVNEFYNLLKNVCVERGDSDTPLRFILGYMYCGGDDGAFIMPSKIALPFALYVMNKYYELMGGKSTLSVGIASAKPKHPIIPLFDSADELLSHAKSCGGRNLCYEYVHSRSEDKLSTVFRGAISFYYIDTGRVSSEYISDILDILYRDRVSTQKKYTYTLSDINQEHSILKLIRAAIPDLSNLDLSNPVFIKDILNRVFDKKFIDSLKDVREIVKNTLSISLAGGSDAKLRVAYMITKGGDEFKVVKEKKLLDIPTLISMLLYQDDEDGMILRLIDLELVIKLLGGGDL